MGKRISLSLRFSRAKTSKTGTMSQIWSLHVLIFPNIFILVQVHQRYSRYSGFLVGSDAFLWPHSVLTPRCISFGPTSNVTCNGKKWTTPHIYNCQPTHPCSLQKHEFWKKMHQIIPNRFSGFSCLLHFGARTFSTSKCAKQTKMRHAFCHHVSKPRKIRKRQVGHGHAHHCKTTIGFILDLLSVARVHLSDWVLRRGNPTPHFYALLPKHAIPGPGESTITSLLSSLPATWTSTLHCHRNFHPCTIPSHSLTAPTHALIAFALIAASLNPWRPSAIWTWTLHFVMFCLISPQHVGLAHQHIEQTCLQSTQFRRLWQQHPSKKPNSIFLVLL